jgi:hypothetical protein
MVLALIKSALGSGKETERDRRSMPRLEETRATLVLNGVSYPLIDWNPKGFQIAPYKGKLKAGNAVKVRLIIPHKGQSFGFDLDGKVKRINPHINGIGGVFVDVDNATANKLGKLFEARLT